jgi:hypothetical protein
MRRWLTLDQFLKERAEILSEPKEIEDRPGELRPLDVSYLNIGGSKKDQSTNKPKATTVHASHLADDYPKIGAHVATPLSHLGPGMRDDSFVPPAGSYRAGLREFMRRHCMRRGCGCGGVSRAAHCRFFG